MIHYFHKLAFNAPIKLNGSIIVFEPVGNNAGVRAIDDTSAAEAAQLTALHQFADQQARGVTRISKEIYEQKKNNRQFSKSPHLQSSSLNGIRILDKEASFLPKKPAGASPAVSVNPPAPAIPIAVTPTAQPRAFIPTVRKVGAVAPAK